MPIEDRSLTCRVCGKEFVFSAGEQEFYAEKGLQNEPRHCRECRLAARRDRENNLAHRDFHAVVCAQCGAETTVPFKPTGDRPVYCRDCFTQNRAAK